MSKFDDWWAEEGYKDAGRKVRDLAEIAWDAAEKKARAAALQKALKIAEGPDVAMAFHKNCDHGACCVYRARVIEEIQALLRKS